MKALPIPTAYVQHPAEWRRIVNHVSRANYDSADATAKRLSLYVEVYAERYGRAPDIRGMGKEQRAAGERVAA